MRRAPDGRRWIHEHPRLTRGEQPAGRCFRRPPPAAPAAPGPVAPRPGEAQGGGRRRPWAGRRHGRERHSRPTGLRHRRPVGRRHRRLSGARPRAAACEDPPSAPGSCRRRPTPLAGCGSGSSWARSSASPGWSAGWRGPFLFGHFGGGAGFGLLAGGRRTLRHLGPVGATTTSNRSASPPTPPAPGGGPPRRRGWAAPLVAVRWTPHRRRAAPFAWSGALVAAWVIALAGGHRRDRRPRVPHRTRAHRRALDPQARARVRLGPRRDRPHHRRHDRGQERDADPRVHRRCCSCRSCWACPWPRGTAASATAASPPSCVDGGARRLSPRHRTAHDRSLGDPRRRPGREPQRHDQARRARGGRAARARRWWWTVTSVPASRRSSGVTAAG